jgi:predicted transposase YdaD
LLVITIEDAVARWATKSIEVGPGTRCTPWVIGPSNTPAVTELQDARENVELAVLSAIENAQGTDIQLAERIASAAIRASRDIDTERSRLYLDLIHISLSKYAPEALEATMNSLGYEYQSDFARRYFGQGKAEGRTEGRLESRVEIVLKLLALRFGPLPEAAQTRVRSAQEAQLDIVAERVLTAHTLEEALGPLPLL